MHGYLRLPVAARHVRHDIIVEAIAADLCVDSRRVQQTEQHVAAGASALAAAAVTTATIATWTQPRVSNTSKKTILKSENISRKRFQRRFRKRFWKRLMFLSDFIGE